MPQLQWSDSEPFESRANGIIFTIAAIEGTWQAHVSGVCLGRPRMHKETCEEICQFHADDIQSAIDEAVKPHLITHLDSQKDIADLLLENADLKQKLFALRAHNERKV